MPEASNDNHQPGNRIGGTGEKSGKCPICDQKPVVRYRPFCSKRCADVDLGRWLGERYVIPTAAGESD